MHKNVTFKIYEEKNGAKELIDTFTRDEICQFYISRSDNRTVKLQMQKKQRNGYHDVVFVFTSVHKLF